MLSRLCACVCRSYRKTVVAGIPGLHHLDDMPVTAKERRLAVSFMQGGLEVRLSVRLTC